MRLGKSLLGGPRGVQLSPLHPCLHLLERTGSCRSININVNRAHIELDVAKRLVAASWFQASSTEFSRTKGQLASYALAGKHGRSRHVFRSHFPAMVPGLPSHRLCSVRDPFWFFSLMEKKFSRDLTKLSRVCLASIQ